MYKCTWSRCCERSFCLVRSPVEMITLCYLYHRAEIFYNCPIFAKFCGWKKNCIDCLYQPEQFSSYPAVVTIIGDRAVKFDICLAFLAVIVLLRATPAAISKLYLHGLIRMTDPHCPQRDSNPRVARITKYLYATVATAAPRGRLGKIGRIYNIKIFYMHNINK